MRNNKLYRFIIGVIFLISFVSFFLYIRIYLMIKGLERINISPTLEISLVRYRNIGVFCLILAIFIIFLNSFFSYLRINRNYYNEDRVLDRISSNSYSDRINSSFDENNIINNLLKDKTLKVVFYNSALKDRIVKFKEYDKRSNKIEFYDLSNDEIYEDKREYTLSSPIKFVLNLIVILLCIILILLCINKISLRNRVVKNNFNINTIEKKY